MELNEEERKGKEKSHQRAAEYEMNMILEMLDIKEWRWPSLAMDEIDLPQDAPLGCYSPETLTQYIDTEEQISVKIDYYFGGFMPERQKETVQIFTIYRDGRQYRMGYVIWSFWGRDVETYEYCKRDETGWKEGDGVRMGKPLSCEKKPAMLAAILQRMAYKEKNELTPENFNEVMEIFLMIKDEDGLLRLGRLPLTGKFLNQCIDSFPYLEKVRNITECEVDFWGIGEDNKLICQCILAPSTGDPDFAYDSSEEHSVYLVEIKLENGQIDDMKITLEAAYDGVE